MGITVLTLQGFLYVPIGMNPFMRGRSSVHISHQAIGKIDIYWHNAGIAGPGIIERTTEEDFDRHKLEKLYLEKMVAGRMLKSEEIANVAQFLCTDDAAIVSGTILPADGGMSIS